MRPVRLMSRQKIRAVFEGGIVILLKEVNDHSGTRGHRCPSMPKYYTFRTIVICKQCAKKPAPRESLKLPPWPDETEACPFSHMALLNIDLAVFSICDMKQGHNLNKSLSNVSV